MSKLCDFLWACANSTWLMQTRDVDRARDTTKALPSAERERLESESTNKARLYSNPLAIPVRLSTKLPTQSSKLLAAIILRV